DAKGAFRFEGVSPDPGMVYLVGTRIGGVPFGSRARFVGGQHELTLDIAVSEPIRDASRITLEDVRLRLAQGCTHPPVQQALALRNASSHVIYIPPEQREGAQPLLEAALPAGAEGFELTLAAGADDVERSGEKLRFWGPLHPGRHEL